MVSTENRSIVELTSAPIHTLKNSGKMKAKHATEPSAVHNEYAAEQQNSTAALQEIINYDNSGPSGIFRSPYVFGAALLASFGGFSFGYGNNL